MQTRILACLLLFLVAPAVQAAAVGRNLEGNLLSRSSNSGPSLASRGMEEERQDWCEKDQDGVVLWLPSGEKNFDYKQIHGPRTDLVVGPHDVRQSSILGETSGLEDVPVVQARMAVMAAWAKTSPQKVYEAFRFGDDQKKDYINWCLPSTGQLNILSQNGDISNSLTKNGEDLKNLVHSVREQAKGRLVPAWPNFINKAYLKDAVANSPKGDNCSQLVADEVKECLSEPWTEGEKHAVDFLSAVTGQECQITGDHEGDSAAAEQIVFEAQKGEAKPVIVILPDETNNDNGYLKGFWAVHKTGEHTNGTKFMDIWDHVSVGIRTVNLPAKMKVVHLKG